MEGAVERFLEICSTVVHPVNDAKKHTSLALEAVKVKNEAGLDLSDPTKLSVNGKNPLYEACRAGHVQIIKLFLAHGADLNVMDESGVSPLYSALTSFHGGDSTINYLLDAGADANLYTESRSPLLASFYNMKIHASIRLIQKGADVNNTILPSFSFVESVFALNSNLVMVAWGVRFQLEQFDQLMSLSYEIVRAGLSPRTFYMTGRRSHQKGFTSDELNALWQFQSMCLAIGFKVDRYSLHGAIGQLQQAISDTSDSRHKQTLYRQLEHFFIMDYIGSSPLSLTRLTRMSIRFHLASCQIHPARHLNEKIERLPLPVILRDFIALKGL